MRCAAVIALVSIVGCKDDRAPSPPLAPTRSAPAALKQVVADVEELDEPPPGTVFPPPTDADFAAIHPVLDPTLGTVCAIRIQVAPGANYNKTRVNIAYARDGRLSARVDEFYSRDGLKRERRDAATYTWENGRLAETPFSTLAYDSNGLLVGQSWGAGSSRILVWRVSPITTYVPFTFPSYVEERAQLPWQLPYSGTVTVTQQMTGSKDKTETFTYDTHGVLVRSDQRRDASGMIVRDGSTTWRWRDNAVVVHDLGSSVYDFTYDDRRRLVRERLTWQGLFAEELRWDYRCPGPWIDDPIWPQ